MERCGTHTVTDVMKVACRDQFECWHEKPPFLCREAYTKFCNQRPYYQDLATKVAQHTGNVLCESNHRFGFFIPELSKSLPMAKFLVLVREPVETLISRFANLSFVSEVLPLLRSDIAARLERNYHHDFNAFRIKPSHHGFTQPYQFFLFDLVHTVRRMFTDLFKLNADQFKVIHTLRIPDHVPELLNWIDPTFPWDYENAYQQSTVRADSVYAKSDRADLLEYAKELFLPHRQEIETEFLLAATGRALPETVLPNFLANPVGFIRNIV